MVSLNTGLWERLRLWTYLLTAARANSLRRQNQSDWEVSMIKIHDGPLPENSEYCHTDYRLLITHPSGSNEQGMKWVIALLETRPNQPSVVTKRSLIRQEIESKYAHHLGDPLKNR